MAAVDELRGGEVVAFGEDRGAVVSTWGLRTLRGNRYWAVTTTVVDGDQSGPDGFAMGRLEGAVELGIESVDGGGVRVLATSK